MPEPLRIFISSPGDVGEERRRASIVIGRIRREFGRFFEVSPILWEYEPMLSSGHFQDIIERPSETDIVVVILWSRLGTPLPSDRYQGLDGRIPVTGTEWEFEDALASKRARGSPDVLVYRKSAPAISAFSDPAALAESQAQWEQLEDFWLRHFINRDGTFKAAFNAFRTLDEFEDQLESHLRSLLRDRVAAVLKSEGSAPAAWHAGSPFRGLSSFGPEHASIFFGREAAEQALVERLAQRAEAGEALVLVVGASGGGKSSLLRAGVLPTLEAPGVVSGVRLWRRLILTPGELGPDPFRGLADRLLADRVLPGMAKPEALANILREAPEEAGRLIVAALAGAAEAAGIAKEGAEARLFILVDQLEEVFTAPGFTEAARDAFGRLLTALARSGGVWVTATMRSDGFGRAIETPGLAALTASEAVYTLAAPRPAEIEQMIRLPAQAAGVAYENEPSTGIGLDSELMEAASGRPDILPLLEFTLDALYRRDIEEKGGRFLTYASYRALGGLEGALAGHAEETVAALPTPVSAELPAVLRALVAVDDDGRAGARPAPLSSFEADPAQADLVRALVDARLLAASGEGSKAQVRIVHEALLRAWPRAQEIIAADGEALRTRARIESAAARWRAEDESPDFLLPRGRPLAEAAELLEARGDELEPGLVRYVEISKAAEEERRRAETALENARAEAEAAAARERAERASEAAAAAQRLARRTRAAAAVLGVLAILAAGAGAYAMIKRQEAVRERNTALESQSRFLAEAAFQAEAAGDARTARLLALAALPTNLGRPDRPYVRDAEVALAQAWGDDRLIRIEAAPAKKPDAPADPNAKPGPYAKRSALLLQAINDGSSFAFSADGQVMAISGGGRARVYDIASNLLLDAPHTGEVGAIALDRTGAQFAQAGAGGAEVWRVAAKARQGLLGSAPATKLAFSPDGMKLAAGGPGGEVMLWALPDGRPLGVGKVSGATYRVTMSPDSRRALVTGADGQAGLYDLGDGHLVASLGEAAQETGELNARTLRQGVSFAAAFSPDSRLVALALDQRRVRLYEAAAGAAAGGVLVHDAPVQSIGFAADDRVTVKTLDDRSWTWAARAPGQARPILAGVVSAYPSPDGKSLAVADATGLHVVDAEGRRLRTLATGAFSEVEWSPTGDLVAAIQDKTNAVLIPAAGGAPRTVFRADAGATLPGLAFTSKGGRLLIYPSIGALALIDPGAGRLVARLGGEDYRGTALIPTTDDLLVFGPGRGAERYGPDGRRAAAMAADGGSLMGIGADGPSKLVATVGLGSGVDLWNVEDGKHVAALQDGQSLGATRVSFKPGPGGWLARGDANQTVAVWPWPSAGPAGFAKAPAKRLAGHSGLLTRLRPVGERLLTEGQDHLAFIWDPLSGRPLARYEGVDRLRVSEAANRLFILGRDGVLRVADLPPSGQALFDAARAKGGALSAAERARYFLSR